VSAVTREKSSAAFQAARNPGRFLLLAVALCALALGGCARANWIVVHQAKPNPLLGQKSFVVSPVEFEELGIKKEHQDAIRHAYNYELRKEGQGHYRFVLPEDAKPGDVAIRTTFYRVDSSDSAVDVRVQLIRDGEVLDEFRLESESGYSIFHGSRNQMSLGYASDRQRLDKCGEELGENVTQYIKTRTE